MARPCTCAASGVLAGREAGLRPGGARSRVDLQGLHVTQVQHDAAFGHAVAGGAVSTTAHGEFEPFVAREGHHARDVIGVRRLDDDRRVPVDAAVEDGARGVVPVIAGGDDAAAHEAADFSNRYADWRLNQVQAFLSSVFRCGPIVVASQADRSDSIDMYWHLALRLWGGIAPDNQTQ